MKQTWFYPKGGEKDKLLGKSTNINKSITTEVNRRQIFKNTIIDYIKIM